MARNAPERTITEPSAAAVVAPQLRRLAEALKSLRDLNGWTLAQVSERTGLSISTLSKVQKGQMSLTYDKIADLSAGLGVDVGYFFAPGPNVATATPAPAPSMVTARRSVERAGDGVQISTPTYDQRYPAADLSNKQLLPIFADLKARTLEEAGGLLRYPGEEFTVVTQGRVEVHTEFYAPVLLEEGDSIYLDSTMGHAYLASGKGPCRILTVCTAPEATAKDAFDRQARGDPTAPRRPRVERARKSATD